MQVCVAWSIAALVSSFEQRQILISVSLHFLRIDSLIYPLPAASISADIDDVEKSTLKLLLQPSERNALSAIGVSHFLTVAFGDDGDCGQVIFKELNLKLAGERSTH